MMRLQKEYRLRNNIYTVVGEYTLCGLLQMQLYPRKDEWGWQREVWRQAQHDYGDPGHRLSLIRHDNRVRFRSNKRCKLPCPPSWNWD